MSKQESAPPLGIGPAYKEKQNFGDFMGISDEIEVAAMSLSIKRRRSPCHPDQVWQRKLRNKGKEICPKVCCTFRVFVAY